MPSSMWMQGKICPECQHIGRFLAEASKNASVNYYRCDECWHVWAYDKQYPEVALGETALGVKRPITK